MTHDQALQWMGRWAGVADVLTIYLSTRADGDPNVLRVLENYRAVAVEYKAALEDRVAA